MLVYFWIKETLFLHKKKTIGKIKNGFILGHVIYGILVP